MIGIIASIAVGAIISTTNNRWANLVVAVQVDNPISDSKKDGASDFIICINGNNPSSTEFLTSVSAVKVSLVLPNN